MEETYIKDSEEEILLSICIPTYNRISRTSKLVEDVLSYKGNDIEVIVVDNCSSDETEVILSNITDSRFRYIRNKTNIGGMPNILNSLNHGSGRFVFLCLDKDRILPENISLFIKRLSLINAIVGQCSLNSLEHLDDVVYEEGLESLLNIAYTSEHPSGLFIKNSVLKQKTFIQDIVNKYQTFAFLPELLKAEVVVTGKASRINIPFVITETLQACEKEISHTYKGENIYFFPKNIINTLNVYLENLTSLNIDKKDKLKAVERIFSSLLIASTLGYKNIMKNRSICIHHGINTKNIGLLELLKINYLFSKAFITSSLSMNVFAKLRICIIANMKIVNTIIRNKFKK